MAVDPEHRYSNGAESANWDIYDDLKLKKTLSFIGMYKQIFQRFNLLTAGAAYIRVFILY